MSSSSRSCAISASERATSAARVANWLVYRFRRPDSIRRPVIGSRLAIALRQIWEAMHRIGCTTAEAENGVEQIVRNSIPPDRLIVFDFLARETLPVRTADVGKLVSASSSTVRRRLEDLEALGVVVKSGDEDRGYEWELSVWGKDNTRYAT